MKSDRAAQGFMQLVWKTSKHAQSLWAICATPWQSWWKSFSLCLVWTSPLSTYCPSFSHQALLWGAWHHLPNYVLIGIGGLLLGSPEAVSSLHWTSPVLQILLTGQVLQHWLTQWPSIKNSPISQGLSVLCGVGQLGDTLQAGCNISVIERTSMCISHDTIFHVQIPS